MSKKLKGVALDSSAYGGYGDAKIRLKHHTLLQDYQDLQKETDATKKRLETAKQRKATLLAEVRFLRRRHKYLSALKSINSIQVREKELVGPVPSETQNKFSGKIRITKQKDAMVHKLPPLPNSNHKGRVYSKKESSRGNAIASLDVDHHRQTRRAGKEATKNNVTPIIDLNQSERIYSGNNASMRISLPALDLNQDTVCGKEASFRTRAPIFDLNEISTEEDDVQSNSAPLKLEDLKRSLMKGGSEEQQQHNDLKLSVCRNVGEGSSRVGKRKISWQDPVALRV